MDFSDVDPMFGSAVFQDVVSSLPGSLHLHTLPTTSSMNEVMDFDCYSRPTKMESCDLDVGVDSPSSESYSESDDGTSMLGFQDSAPSSTEMMEDDSKMMLCSTSPVAFSDSFLENKYNADRNLVLERWGPHDVFPADKTWSLEQKAAKLIQLSPCKKYTVNDLLHIESLERAEDRVNILIEIVAGIKVNFRWNYVRPQELFKSYTVVTNCKKEKEKKDTDGNTIPKRPMNAFMIWCQKCRTLMSHICPQLHNAIISKALGAAWKMFSAEERAVYEEEKIKLMAFHQHEFPDYKYRPKKKLKKSEEKSSPVPKSKQKKKSTSSSSDADKNSSSTSATQSPSASTAPLLVGINIADEARQGLDPLLKERLQVKMQVKIDSDLKRGIGKRSTAIDLADLSGFQSDFISISSSSSPNSGRLFIDSQSSVFDTPENSPHEPHTPPESATTTFDPSTCTIISRNGFSPETPAFTFDDKVAIQLQMENNNSTTTNNNNPSSPNHNLFPELSPSSPPSSQATLPFLSEIKSEPVDLHSVWINNNNMTPIEVKRECIREVNGMPVLSVEYVESVLDDELYEAPDMNDLMKFITTPDILNESTSQFIFENSAPLAVSM